jgi:hypothetical protein
MDNQLENLYIALDQADSEGNVQDANDIAIMIKEYNNKSPIIEEEKSFIENAGDKIMATGDIITGGLKGITQYAGDSLIGLSGLARLGFGGEAEEIANDMKKAQDITKRFTKLDVNEVQAFKNILDTVSIDGAGKKIDNAQGILGGAWALKNGLSAESAINVWKDSLEGKEIGESLAQQNIREGGSPMKSTLLKIQPLALEESLNLIGLGATSKVVKKGVSELPDLPKNVLDIKNGVKESMDLAKNQTDVNNTLKELKNFTTESLKEHKNNLYKVAESQNFKLSNENMKKFYNETIQGLKNNKKFENNSSDTFTELNNLKKEIDTGKNFDPAEIEAYRSNIGSVVRQGDKNMPSAISVRDNIDELFDRTYAGFGDDYKKARLADIKSRQIETLEDAYTIAEQRALSTNGNFSEILKSELNQVIQKGNRNKSKKRFNDAEVKKINTFIEEIKPKKGFLGNLGGGFKNMLIGFTISPVLPILQQVSSSVAKGRLNDLAKSDFGLMKKLVIAGDDGVKRLGIYTKNTPKANRTENDIITILLDQPVKKINQIKPTDEISRKAINRLKKIKTEDNVSDYNFQILGNSIINKEQELRNELDKG